MSVELLSKEEKLRILRTIEVDEEFRRALMGALGYGELLKRMSDILEELRKLREDFNRRSFEHDKRFEVLEEELKRLREDFNKLYQKSLEHDKRFEAIERELLEHSKILQEHSKILQEHSKILQEHSKRIEELTKAVGELKAAVGSIGRRMGRDLEKLILNIYRDAIERFGIDVERIEKRSFRDYDGKYLQKGAKIELDIYMSNNVTYLIEVKSFVDEDDVEWFNTKCWIFAREFGMSSYRKMIVAVNVTKEALERAKELGIDVVYGSIVD